MDTWYSTTHRHCWSLSRYWSGNRQCWCTKRTRIGSPQTNPAGYPNPQSLHRSMNGVHGNEHGEMTVIAIWSDWGSDIHRLTNTTPTTRSKDIFHKFTVTMYNSNSAHAMDTLIYTLIPGSDLRSPHANHPRHIALAELYRRTRGYLIDIEQIDCIMVDYRHCVHVLWPWGSWIRNW